MLAINPLQMPWMEVSKVSVGSVEVPQEFHHYVAVVTPHSQPNSPLLTPIPPTELETAEELYQRRITRIVTQEFPHYFAVVTRVRQESSTVGPGGGMISSTVVPQVQVQFPEGALTKKIKVGLQVDTHHPNTPLQQKPQ